MKVLLRADASVSTGAGHIIRCLSLADALTELGASVLFVSREQEGDLNDVIAERGFEVARLPASSAASWLEDAEQTRAVLGRIGRPDWLVVDHYGIDSRWESALAGCVGRIMVIDDLANRAHECDLLLDQNAPNPLHERYAQVLPRRTRQLLGTRYALVRPEFRGHRAAALARRDGRISRLLVSMGGTDPRNDTAKALDGIAVCGRDGLAADVVVGRSNPHLAAIRAWCQGRADVQLHVQTSRMAELMTRADLAICGGGSTTWERCVLGLPAIAVIQSDDQIAIARALEGLGAHRLLGWAAGLQAYDYGRAIAGLTADELVRMSTVSAGLCDGEGAIRVATQLCNWE